MNKNKQFVKMHGAGNDFIIVEPSFFGLKNLRTKLDTFSEQQKQIIVPQVIELCQQKFSIGANGVLIVSEVEGELYKMSVFNADGSMGANCGNGLRCIAVYLHKKKGLGLTFTIATDNGDKLADIIITENKQYYVKINLQQPSPISQVNFDLKHNPQIYKYMYKSSTYSCQIGNNHLIIFFQKEQFQNIEKDNAFAQIANELIGKDSLNVNFCLVQSHKDLKIVTCQFGAGVTMACGTGSSVSAYVGFATGRLQYQANVHNRGGVLKITCEKKQKLGYEIFMNGPAKFVYFGQIQTDNK